LQAKGVKNYGLRKQGRNDTIKSKKEIKKYWSNFHISFAFSTFLDD
jgi:hypothetical protein